MASSRTRRARFETAAREHLRKLRLVALRGTAEEKRGLVLFLAGASIYGKTSSTAGRVHMPAIRDDFDAAAVRSRAESITSGQRK